MEYNGREAITVYPIYAKSIFLEHDYSVSFVGNNNNNNNNRENEREENVLGTKLHRAFHAVDKWAGNVILRTSTAGDDEKKMVDREISIHKVKYPFLPEQQIRGKVYKKFGIPAVMGGVSSRYVPSVSGSSLKQRPCNQKKRFKKIVCPKITPSLEVSEYGPKCYPPAAEKKHPNIVEITEKQYSDKSNSPLIHENTMPSMDMLFQTSVRPNSGSENSPPLASPLKLAQTSLEHQINPPTTGDDKRENLPIVTSPFSSAATDSNSRNENEISNDPVSIYSQQTQMIDSPQSPLQRPTFVRTKCSICSGSVGEPTSKTKMSEISAEIHLEEMPTQICASLTKKCFGFMDAKKYSSLQPAQSQGRKRKSTTDLTGTIYEISPADRLFKCNKEINKEMPCSRSISDCKNINHSRISVCRVSSPDPVNLDHSYSGMRKMSEVGSKNLKIVKNPYAKFAKIEPRTLENTLTLENRNSLKYKNSDEKENITRHSSCVKLDGKNIILSSNAPLPLSEKKKCSPNAVTTSSGINVLNNEEMLEKKETLKCNCEIDGNCTVSSSQVDILPANFIPWRGDMPLFLVVDSLSNHCCEYDIDSAKMTKISELAMNLRNGSSLKENLEINCEEYKLREKIEEILGFLENDCKNRELAQKTIEFLND